MVLYEFELNNSVCFITLPRGAVALCVATKRGVAYVYFLADQHEGNVQRKLRGYYNHGAVDPGEKYIGTVMLEPAYGYESTQPPTACHIFDCGEVQ